MSTLPKEKIKVKAVYFKDKVDYEKSIKEVKTFNGDDKEKVLSIKVDKNYFKENFEAYEEMKIINQKAKEYNEQAVSFARELAQKELKKEKGINRAEIKIPNGPSQYDNITVSVKLDGEDSKLRYKANYTSIFPSKKMMKDEKSKLLKDLLGK